MLPGSLQAAFLIFDDIVWPGAEMTDAGVYGRGVYRRDRWPIGATLRVDRVEAEAGETSAFFLANTVGDLDQTESIPVSERAERDAIRPSPVLPGWAESWMP